MNLIYHEIAFLKDLANDNIAANEFGTAACVFKDMQALLDEENPATVMLSYHDNLQEWLQSWYDNWWQYASGDVEDEQLDELIDYTKADEAFDNLKEAYGYAFGDKHKLFLHCVTAHVNAELHEALNS